MLQFLGVVLILMTVGAVVTAIAGSLFVRPASRILAGAAAGAWLGIVIDAVASGAVKQLPLFGALFAAPLMAAIVAFLAIPELRSRVLNISPRIIVGINSLRIIGVLFVAMAYTGALTGPFPYFAGIGDIITGLVAIGLISRAPSLSASDSRVAGWNTIGTIDLLVAVSLGITSHNAELTQLPWALIPLFLVPCYLAGHAVIYAQILSSPSRRRVQQRSAA